MEEIRKNCENRLDRVLKKNIKFSVNRDIISIIAKFLYSTDVKTGSILIDSAHFMPRTSRHREASMKLFVVTRRTRCHAYIRELTDECKYRRRTIQYRLGQMVVVFA